ncbi:MAG TPA: cytochrome b N-terminal domain-containing protein [Nevskiaceae bacterium]|nr:cytochrome b N-terminal domain-containing protein [Nevskiaceae bacterium]
MAIEANPYKTTGFLGWIDNRFPLTKLWKTQVSEYYAPKNFNFWYYFGSLLLLVLVNQIVTGIFLVMHYHPSAANAFNSVQFIMRDVDWGWLIRYMHAIGASAFFICIYLHMYRGIIYGSHHKPRELIWVFGCFLFFVLMAEAFCGYVLPWGNMSYWGSKVILSLFGAIPVVGAHLQTWVMGDFTPSGATLRRLFSFHVILLPLVLLLLVVMHLMALHEVGSNNPDGVDIHKHEDANGVPLDGVPFHPYYSVKDLVGVCVFLVIFFAFVFFDPTGGHLVLEHDNMIPANPIVTPPDIHPAWYFAMFYAMLRSVPAFFDLKIWGVLVMFGAVVILFFLPWLDKSGVRSIRYKGWIFKAALTIFTLDVLVMFYFGMQPVRPLITNLSRIGTLIYYLFFLLMPFYSKWDKTKPVPERVTE